MFSSTRLSTQASSQPLGFLARGQRLLTPGRLRIVLAINVVVLGLLIWPLLKPDPRTPAAISAPVTSAVRTTATTPSPSPSPTASQTPKTHSQLVTSLSEITPEPTKTQHLQLGLVVLSITEGGYNRLFAFQPDNQQLIRITDGPWDDITPAISPDRTQVAFASNRNDYWNLYLLDLSSGETFQLTDGPGYKAAPSWSPDGSYLVYEAYLEDKLRLVILDVSGTQPPIVLRNQSQADFSPAWSPLGRQIAFASINAGKREIWIADLDKSSQERFTKLSGNPSAVSDNPAWSPDGARLVWSSFENGFYNIYIYNGQDATRFTASGDLPVWSSDGSTLLTILTTPNQTLLTAYSVDSSIVAIPPVLLPGPVSGMTWSNGISPYPLVASIEKAAQMTPTPLWQPALTSNSDTHLVPLENVNAPNPHLHEMVAESFKALRQRVTFAVGWDLLADLENAYVPITAPLPPGLGNNWLYSGRSFALNPLPINAGWMVVIRQEYGSDIYWRIYLRARDQDGSQGMPLKEQPWDFNRRHQGDMADYEQGGGYYETIPDGYWVDFTVLAAAYGWQRLPALPTWQSAFPAARFNQFVLSDDWDWQAAMLELYPPEVLITPTLFVPPTLTPSATPRWYRTPTPVSP